jgi:hypothetical protein
LFGEQPQSSSDMAIVAKSILIKMQMISAKVKMWAHRSLHGKKALRKLHHSLKK